MTSYVQANWTDYENRIPTVEAGEEYDQFTQRCTSELTGDGLNSGLAAALCSLRWEKDVGETPYVEKTIWETNRGIVDAFKRVWALYCSEDVDITLIPDGGEWGFTGWDNKKQCYVVGLTAGYPRLARRMVETLFHELGHIVKDAWNSFIDVSEEQHKALLAGDRLDVAPEKDHRKASVERTLDAWAETRADEWYELIMLDATGAPGPLQDGIKRNWDRFKTVRQLAKRSLEHFDTPEVDRRENTRQELWGRVRRLQARLAAMRQA